MKNAYKDEDFGAAWKTPRIWHQLSNFLRQKFGINVDGLNDAELADVFIAFFARFEKSDFICNLAKTSKLLVPNKDLTISQEIITNLPK